MFSLRPIFSCQSLNVWVTPTGESLFLMGGIIRHMQTSNPKGLFLPSFSLNYQNNDDFMILIMLFSGPDSLVLLLQKEQESFVSQYGPGEKMRARQGA